MSSSSPPFPAENPRVKFVASFDELASTRFNGGVNALCWRRELPGDFGEVVTQLRPTDDVAAVSDADLHGLNLQAAGQCARDQLLEDLQLLRSRELAPVLNCIRAYPVKDQ